LPLVSNESSLLKKFSFFGIIKYKLRADLISFTSIKRSDSLLFNSKTKVLTLLFNQQKYAVLGFWPEAVPGVGLAKACFESGDLAFLFKFA